MPKAKKSDGLSTLMMSKKFARSIETFSEYSKLSGVPLEKLIDECLTEYIKSTVETSKS